MRDDEYLSWYVCMHACRYVGMHRNCLLLWFRWCWCWAVVVVAKELQGWAARQGVWCFLGNIVRSMDFERITTISIGIYE